MPDNGYYRNTETNNSTTLLKVTSALSKAPFITLWAICVQTEAASTLFCVVPWSMPYSGISQCGALTQHRSPGVPQNIISGIYSAKPLRPTMLSKTDLRYTGLELPYTPTPTFITKNSRSNVSACSLAIFAERSLQNMKWKQSYRSSLSLCVGLRLSCSFHVNMLT